MKSYMIVLVAALALPVSANIISTPAKPIIGINAGEVGKRVCYYQDKAYSDGAIVQIDEYYMICAAANDYELNGALKWHSIDQYQAEQPANKEQSGKPVKRYSVN
ncbi:YnjH family protein [Vibrio europaeus]|uniref:DUF1496 domain-containing protein n=1 Tax=Vibrio europaeus TaxID=300876 RepID=A0AAE7AS83_9VIBR|nr:DUF1496 domain-containing protein [Vibrio europaeus]MDC5803436.1 YnjH family protein [Vibrio europaeus]MDC5810656.1 YnjH family protein [Vibrio europaeus]MDC5822552.1 YnjH family protein [Vibrio europaeus]MDC5823308.1 YnjH family protein [Vibrio europaeus]MDC5828853.1 YnjH family protein [Vibrio europaeus]